MGQHKWFTTFFHVRLGKEKIYVIAVVVEEINTIVADEFLI